MIKCSVDIIKFIHAAYCRFKNRVSFKLVRVKVIFKARVEPYGREFKMRSEKYCNRKCNLIFLTNNMISCHNQHHPIVGDSQLLNLSWHEASTTYSNSCYMLHSIPQQLISCNNEGTVRPDTDGIWRHIRPQLESCDLPV